MNLQSIIANLAGRADELLADARDRKEARVMLGEVLAREQPKMTAIDRQKTTVTVLDILEEEGFFEASVDREWADGEDEEE